MLRAPYTETMSFDLEQARALVTGSTAGIGLATALELAWGGAHVHVNGRTQARVDAAIAQIRREAPAARVDGIAADLGSAEGCATLVRQLPELDILVNNVGIFEPKPFERISDADWQRLFEVNVLSGVRLSRAYLPGMKQRNRGRIVFVSSESAVHIPAEMIHYGMTKTAQVAVARGLAEDCAGTAVTVNSVLPGPTASEGVSAFVHQLAQRRKMSTAEFEREFFHSMRPSSLIQRFLDPSEVARVIAFVCSPEASAITGAAVRADGGIVRAAL